MASLKGLYLAPESQPVAYDLSAAKTVLSIGAPLLDGWGTPANVIAARQNFRLIQAEAVESRTAVLADEWIPLAPGTERAFAQQILGALQGERTSVLASELAANGPSLVIGDAPEIPEINRLLGAWGKTVVAPPEAPVPDSWKKSAAAVTAARRRAGPFHPRAADRRIRRRKLHPVAPDRARNWCARIRWW